MKPVGQIIGFAAMFVSMVIYLQRRRKNVLFLKLTSDILWAAHHLMILSYTAALTTSLAIFREIVFYNYDKKWANSKWWCAAFSFAFIAAAIATWKDVFSIIPVISSVLATIAFGSKRILMTKIFAFAASVGMLFYGLHYSSAATVVNECLTEATILMSFIVGRYYKNVNDY